MTKNPRKGNVVTISCRSANGLGVVIWKSNRKKPRTTRGGFFDMVETAR